MKRRIAWTCSRHLLVTLAFPLSLVSTPADADCGWTLEVTPAVDFIWVVSAYGYSGASEGGAIGETKEDLCKRAHGQDAYIVGPVSYVYPGVEAYVCKDPDPYPYRDWGIWQSYWCTNSGYVVVDPGNRYGEYYDYPVCVKHIPPSENQNRYTIRLSSSASNQSNVLAEVEPGKPAPDLVAKVYDCGGRFIPWVQVRLTVDVVKESGGHSHHDSSRPKGKLSNGLVASTEIEGSTGANGMSFAFHAPTVAGDHKISASCAYLTCKLEGPDVNWRARM